MTVNFFVLYEFILEYNFYIFNPLNLIKLKTQKMKRVFSILSLSIALIIGGVNVQDANSAVFAYQDSTETEADASQDVQQDFQDEAEDESLEDEALASDDEALSFNQELKKRFIEGGPVFMGIILLCLILGLAVSIERIIFLNLSTTNTKKLAKNVQDALSNGGVEEAKEVCRNTRGPVASIYYQGLDRADEGLDIAEKAVVSYGGVQMGQMEKNVSWISLFIALAPMLGFMGTVIGMIEAFDRIEAAGDMQPGLVAGGIKVALLTTVFGLIVAVILQVFYNYIIAKIDAIVNDMEDASITLMDILFEYNRPNLPPRTDVPTPKA